MSASRLVKNIINKKMYREAKSLYDRVKSFRDYHLDLVTDIKRDVNTFSVTSNFDSLFGSFNTYLNDYVPTFEKLPKGSSDFIDELVDLFEESLYLRMDEDMLTSLDLSTWQDIYNLERVPTEFMLDISNDIFNGVISTVQEVFDYPEFNLGSKFTNLDFNKRNFDLNTILSKFDIKYRYLSDYSDYNMDLMKNDISKMLSQISLDSNGDVIYSVLSSIGDDNITNVQKISRSYKMLLQNVTNEITKITSTPNFKSFIQDL